MTALALIAAGAWLAAARALPSLRLSRRPAALAALIVTGTPLAGFLTLTFGPLAGVLAIALGLAVLSHRMRRVV